MVEQWTFDVLAILIIASSLATIVRRNPIIAAMFLVLTLLFTAGVFLVLNATFLAAIQILVYAGAVMVLFMFVVMSVPHPESEELGLRRGVFSKILGVLAIGGLGAGLWMTIAPLRSELLAKLGPGFGEVASIGRLLFTEYLYPFEAISLLLLVAIVGAVMVSRRQHTSPEKTP